MSEAARPRGWRRIAAAFGTPAAVTMFFLGFGSGLPFLLIGYTLTIWLRQAGWGLGPIGLVSFISLLYVLKFLWSPLLDTRRLPLFGRLGRRRGWLLPAQLALVASLAAMGAAGPQAAGPFLLLMALTGLAGATQDTMVDAYRIEIAPAEAQGALAATSTLGYRIGLICGGAGTLALSALTSWSAAYAAMGALMLVPAAATLLAREPALSEPAPAGSRPPLREAFLGPFKEFFGRNGWKLGLALLAFVGLFKLPDQMIGVMAGPFYLDSGFSRVDIATVSKLYGVWIGILGAFAGGVAVAAWRMRTNLVAAALALALSNLCYLLMSAYPGQLWSFVAAISGDNFSQGFAGTVQVAFMSRLADKHYTATQYALLSSLAFMPGKLIGGVSGYLVDAWGYPGFFIASTASIVPTLLLLAWLWPRIRQAEANG
jgi:PAT family beta-lactamase induction signal transducer AmpG